MKYILSVDQSTQGTKGLLFDENGVLVQRADRKHSQIVNEYGWVEHDPIEIIRNTLAVCRDTVEKSKILPEDIVAFGISNQRETALAWNKKTGEPIGNAIVWQCARAAEICERHKDDAELVRTKTGITLSPYFPAAKLQWIMENVEMAGVLADSGELAVGTIDSWLIYNLTENRIHKTDYSNASRTQLFNIFELKWDEELCDKFKIPVSAMPEVCMSDSVFGMTDLGGFLPEKIPIHGVLGDSHGALFGQDCRKNGQIKTTYGTGSSVMMNIGTKPKLSDKGIVTSIAWGIDNKVNYVFEGNLNYTGAVISWLKNDVGLIESDADVEKLACEANSNDRAYFVPAFTGLGAPYWDSKATGMMTGIARTTGKKEIAKACLESIAYQITDLIRIMREETGEQIGEVRVDGGPTANTYLMQFQSDIADVKVSIPELQELSGMGAAYLAGIAMKLYDEETIYEHIKHKEYAPRMDDQLRTSLYSGWKKAITQVLKH